MVARFEAFAYHVAKAIAALKIPLDGHVDAIAITGGLARRERLVHRLRDREKVLPYCDALTPPRVFAAG